MLNSYFGVFAGMVGSIDIIAPPESIRSIAVFLEKHIRDTFEMIICIKHFIYEKILTWQYWMMNKEVP